MELRCSKSGCSWSLKLNVKWYEKLKSGFSFIDLFVRGSNSVMATVANDSTLRSLCIYNPELSTKEGTVNLLG